MEIFTTLIVIAIAAYFLMRPKASSNVADTKILENQKAAARRKDVIGDFGAFLEQRPNLPTRIEDVTVLPHPKEEILDALMLEIARGHPNMNEWLEVSATFLAQYQPGVGKEPLDMLGADFSALPETHDLEELRKQAIKMVVSEEKTRGRFEEFNKLVQQDLQRISKLTAAAVILREQMPEEQKARVLG